MIGIEYYGGEDVNLSRIDVRTMECLSVDLRATSGMRGAPDESCLLPAGTFTLSVVGQLAGDHPIGEIRFYYGPMGKEIRLVGHLTGRPGITEMTSDHILAMMQDDAYRGTMLEWLKAS